MSHASSCYAKPLAGTSAEAPWLAFDGIAETYDAAFTRSEIGRAQRRATWASLKRTFRPGDRILELNCGTGEDALFLGRRGASVVACDASAGMIAVARRRKGSEAPQLPVRFEVLRTEELGRLQDLPAFDGAFSNFSGLNCVSDLRSVAEDLSHLVRFGGKGLICISTRICAGEIACLLARGHVRKAFRRVRGGAIARLGGHDVGVHYPTIRQVRRAFAPSFRLRSIRAIGLFVPPSYMEPWAVAHPRMLRCLERMDRRLATWPLLRGIGDHVLLEFQKVAP